MIYEKKLKIKIGEKIKRVNKFKLLKLRHFTNIKIQKFFKLRNFLNIKNSTSESIYLSRNLLHKIYGYGIITIRFF
jgi:hypothetical protein